MSSRRSSFRIKKSIAKMQQHPIKYLTRNDFEKMIEQLKQQGMWQDGFDPNVAYDVDGQPYYPPARTGPVPIEARLALNADNKITTASWNLYKQFCQALIEANPAYIYVRQSIAWSGLSNTNCYLTYDNLYAQGYRNGIMASANDDYIIDLVYNRNTDTFFIQYKRVNNQAKSVYVIQNHLPDHPEDMIPVDTLEDNELIEPPNNNLYLWFDAQFTNEVELTNQIYDHYF